MFALTSQTIDPAKMRRRLEARGAGALVIFEGRVRDHHRGRPVTRLEYESFDALAVAEGEAVVAEAERLHPGARIECVHRTGTLEVGEIAVWIGVESPHRQAGFAACRHVIEDIKRRLPIWKKEHHPDGAAEWVNCTAEAGTNIPAEYYSRQAALPEVGPAGQERLAAARVLVVGLGGLGCPAATYLAGAGIGRLTLVDSGQVEVSNLHRQPLFTMAEVGTPKVLAGAARLRLQNPGIEIAPLETELTTANVRSLVAGQSVVLDCTDNFASRFVLHDACLALGIPLVQAAVHRFEGTLDVFCRGEGGCIHCLWPAAAVADLEAVGGCDGAPVFAPAVGVLGVMQAAEALKLLLGLAGDAPRQTRLLNLRDGTALAVERPVRPDCPVCGSVEKLRAAAPSLAGDDPLLVDPERLEDLDPLTRFVFLAEPNEPPALVAAEGAIPVPIHDLARLREMAAAGPLVLSCRHGVRSAAIARLLRSEGITTVRALVARAPFVPPTTVR